MSIIPSCKEVSELLSQAQDRRLSLREKFALHVHLPLCEGCRNVNRQLDFLRAAIQRYLDRDEPR
jgi:hypothetical protein